MVVARAMHSSPLTGAQPGVEMFQRTMVQQPIYKARSSAPRPVSEATEMYDTDFEDDFEDEASNSPRTSIESFGKKSDTTLSSYDELLTPSSNQYAGFDFHLDQKRKSVEGPKGPHLFRVSQDSSTSQDYGFHLSMSPLTPKETPLRSAITFKVPPVPYSPATNTRPLSTLTEAVARLETAEVRSWSPRQVATWMYDAGFEAALVEKFESNDISGAILVDLKFEDLKELDIQSFGKRHRLWNEIHNLRPSPVSSSQENSRSSSLKGDGIVSSRRYPQTGDCSPDDDEGHSQLRRNQSSRRQRRPVLSEDHIISPAESVSIVGIEQLIPPPHKCNKGERCPKFRKQQRLAQMAQDHPISPVRGGRIVVSGNPGNAAVAENALRPMSDAVPSVVASSDVLGPGRLPAFRLEEESLRTVLYRDPQENVKRFLDFQHMQEPPTPAQPEEEEYPRSSTAPPLDLFPPLYQSSSPPARGPSMHENLRNLPKLSIPYSHMRAATASPSRNFTPTNVYPRGTPSSDMDVPATAVPLGPVARETSQSVPPDMCYRRRSGARHASFGMARVAEDVIWEDPATGMEQDTKSGNGSKSSPMTSKNLKTYNHAGYMKKRKTKFLRHEWQEHHFRLQGTRLAMHQNAKTIDALEHIDVDDYAVACSSIASNKLSAALKSMRISAGRNSSKDGEDASAFAFQLVPAAERGEKVASARRAAGAAAGGSRSLGKTHHFAVKTRDQRIDWMRELMLAKALKQKAEGYEINVNGNMI